MTECSGGPVAATGDAAFAVPFASTSCTNAGEKEGTRGAIEEWCNMWEGEEAAEGNAYEAWAEGGGCSRSTSSICALAGARGPGCSARPFRAPVTVGGARIASAAPARAGAAGRARLSDAGAEDIASERAARAWPNDPGMNVLSDSQTNASTAFIYCSNECRFPPCSSSVVHV